MPLSQLIFFAGWVVAALIGGAALLLVWEKLRVKHQGETPGTPPINRS